jgi:hypothetical protein
MNTEYIISKQMNLFEPHSTKNPYEAHAPPCRFRSLAFPSLSLRVPSERCLALLLPSRWSRQAASSFRKRCFEGGPNRIVAEGLSGHFEIEAKCFLNQDLFGVSFSKIVSSLIEISRLEYESARKRQEERIGAREAGGRGLEALKARFDGFLRALTQHYPEPLDHGQA